MKEFRPFSPRQQEFQKLLGDPDATDILAYGGARSGKTFICLRACVIRAAKCDSTNHLVVRRFFRDTRLKIGMGSLPEVIEACFPDLEDNVHWDKKDWILTLPNKSRIWLGGLDEHSIDRVLGGEYSTILFEEVSELAEEAVDTALTRLAEKSDLRNVAYYTMNPGLREHWTHARFLVDKPDGHRYLVLNPKDNLANIDKSFLRRLERLPEKQRERFLLGQFQDPDEGALWRMPWIASNRVEKYELPVFDEIIVSADPAVTSGIDADEWGIVVVARADDEYYVIDDATLAAPPASAAERVIAMLRLHHADRVVYESNQGGEMTATIIQGIAPDVRCEPVHAQRSKISRAEPVAAFYERGMVHHVGEFSSLEIEMVTYDGKGKSPNRLDALVHGLTYLGCTSSYIAPTVGTGDDESDDAEPEPRTLAEIMNDDALWETCG